MSDLVDLLERTGITGVPVVDVRSRIRELPDDLFEGYRVEDIMTPAPIFIAPGARLGELARLLRERKLHRALVVRDGQLVGIVTTTDILEHLAKDRPAETEGRRRQNSPSGLSR